MADKPILFSGPMVRALLAGTKTQTRRIASKQPTLRPDGLWDHHQYEAGIVGADDASLGAWMADFQRIQLGDRLYVREHWRTFKALDAIAPRDLVNGDGLDIEFIADGANRTFGKHRQAMHMPRWASRLTLTVTDVRVERLQAISEADAQAEGITRIGAEYIARGSKEWERGPNFYQVDIGGGSINDATAVAVYMRLWDWINGEGAADANPWVMAVSFTVQLGNIDQLRAA